MKTLIRPSKTVAAQWLFVTCVLLVPGRSGAQDTLTLDACYTLAEKNYPLADQPPLLAGSSKLKIKTLNKNYLPQFNINGQATYQSDVTKVEISLPAGLPALEMPVLSKDWYKATLDISQSVWDGNVTSYQKKLEHMNLQIDQNTVSAELYKLKERINLHYFTLILLNRNEELLTETKSQLEEKLKELQTGIQFGVVLQSTADALKAEVIRIGQQITETRIERSTTVRMLSELLAVPVSENVILILPDPPVPGFTYENKRIENYLFILQRSRLEMMRNMVTTKWNPKVFAFGQAGIGRPGLNMLSNDFNPFYIVGLKVAWNPFNWNVNRNENKILDIQSSIVGTQQATFDKNLRIQSERDQGEILKARAALKNDEEIIALRKRISATSSTQLDNGIITSSEYVTRLTEERQARLNYEIHKIQVAKAKLAYFYTQGKL